MHLLYMVDQAANLFSKVTEVEEFRKLRGETRSACPEGWHIVRKLELEHWRHFWGFPHALAVMQQNFASNASLPETMRVEMRSLIEYQTIPRLESLAKELGDFANSLTSYFIKPKASLQDTSLHLTSAVRRSIQDIKGCFLGLEEVRNTISTLVKGITDAKKAEGYEGELLKRNILLPISPKAYELALELAGSDRESRRVFIATKQLYDMIVIIRELLFQLVDYDLGDAFYVDGELVSLRYEEKPFGRLVHSHMTNIAPLMIPGQILRFEESSGALPIYVVALSVSWHYNGESKVSTLDLTGIDLEEAGPNLLSRFG